jgi:glycosyltransferase involved in cell wall biosynthesis
MRNWAWSELPKLMRFLKRCKPDAVFLYYSGWLYRYHPMITFAPTVSKAIVPQSNFITQFGIPEGAIPEETSIIARAIRKGITLWSGSEDVDWGFGTLLKDSDRVVVLSGHHKFELIKRYPSVTSRIMVIPPPPIMVLTQEDGGAARSRGRKLLGLKANEFVILYFGYFSPGKGIETLLKAFQLVSQGISDLKLLMVGGDPDNSKGSSYSQKMRDLGCELGLNDKIIWAGGYSSDSDEASVSFRASDACVLPFDDGVALNRSSVAAAANHGLPIVTTRGESLESPFENASVRLCAPKDPKSLAEAICSVVHDQALQERLRLGSLKLAREWFSWENNITRITEALEKNTSRA